MATDYGASFDPTLGYYGGGGPGAAPPYLPLDTSAMTPFPVQSAAATSPFPAPTDPHRAPTPDPTPPTAPTIPTTQAFGPTPEGSFRPPSGIPDPKNPGYDTTGYRIGSTYDAATGVLRIPRPDGSSTVMRLDPKTHQPIGGTAENPFGTINNPAPKVNNEGGNNSGSNIYNPSLYQPFTTPAPVFKQPPPFRAPTLDEAAQNPGYQFGLQQGEQALQQSAAAKGLLRTGGTLKGILDYGRNAATQNYSNVLAQNLGIYNTNLATQYQQPFDNAFTTFIAEQNRFRQNQTDPFNKYLELIKAANPNA